MYRTMQQTHKVATTTHSSSFAHTLSRVCMVMKNLEETKPGEKHCIKQRQIKLIRFWVTLVRNLARFDWCYCRPWW